MAAPTNYYVDPLNGNDSTGNGSIGNPWRSTQKALDTIVKDTTNGDQINLRNTAPDIIAAQLSSTIYGNASVTAPLIIRGYSNVANDGGVGILSGNGSLPILAVSQNFVSSSLFIDLHFTNGGASNLVGGHNLQALNGKFFRCKFSETTGRGLSLRGSNVYGCHFQNCGTGVFTYTASGWQILDCFFENCGTAIVSNIGLGVIMGNIVKITGNNSGFLLNSGDNIVKQNSIYAAGSTGYGVWVDSVYAALIQNNIVVGFSGAGGRAIRGNATTNVFVCSNNKFYDNAANLDLVGDIFADLGNNDVLAAMPFTDPANNDFSVIPEVVGSGYPPLFIGTNTDPNLNPGVVQGGGAGAAPVGAAIVIGGRGLRLS